MGDTKIYSYYFPNWHVDKQNEQWHGTGWTEWNVTKCALPKFEGHVQPKKPLWGYEDEADPKVMEKKIDVAVEHGLDGFIFDWYWYREIGIYREKCLEEGFLKAKNNEKMDFAVMWCNHEAKQLHPSPKTPIGGHPVASSVATWDYFYELTQYCIDNYFSKPNYIKIDGKPFFSIFHPMEFVSDLGEEKAAEAIKDFEERARKAGFAGIHLNVIDNFFYKDKSENAEVAVNAQFSHGNAVVHYLNDEEINDIIGKMNIASTSTHCWPMPEGFPTFDIRDSLPLAVERYKETRAFDAYAFPGILLGWDTSPRTLQSDTFEPGAYPFNSIAVNNTPEFFEHSLDTFYDLIKDDDVKVMTVSSWNEWTEGEYLEPCEEYGYGRLEALKRFRDKTED